MSVYLFDCLTFCFFFCQLLCFYGQCVLVEQLLGRLPESELGDGAPAAAHTAALHRVGGTRGNLQEKHISIVYVV